MSTVTVYLATPTGNAPVVLEDDVAFEQLAGPLAARAGVAAPHTRLSHERVGLLEPAATLRGLGLGDGSVIRVVIAPQPAHAKPEPLTPLNPNALTPVPTIAVGWVGAHGGAGTSTLARLLGGVDQHRTPRTATLATIIVARPTAQGLQAAQHLARRWGEPGPTPRGLVLIAATPGRLPRPLRELRHLIQGAYPQTWHIPWIEQLHRGDPPPRIAALDRLARDLELHPPNHPT